MISTQMLIVLSLKSLSKFLKQNVKMSHILHYELLSQAYSPFKMIDDVNEINTYISVWYINLDIGSPSIRPTVCPHEERVMG